MMKQDNRGQYPGAEQRNAQPAMDDQARERQVKQDFMKQRPGRRDDSRMEEGSHQSIVQRDVPKRQCAAHDHKRADAQGQADPVDGIDAHGAPPQIAAQPGGAADIVHMGMQDDEARQDEEEIHPVPVASMIQFGATVMFPYLGFCHMPMA